MGVSIAELVEGKPIEFTKLQNKIIAIDTFNFLYQFLATIRGPDGTLLTNARGEVTSHLVGLFSRTTRLMQYGMKLVFIIDGDPPELKKLERKRRRELKGNAEREYEIAKQRHDLEAMKKFASRTSRLTKEMVADAIEIIELLGLPYIQAPSEGEAQAAHMAVKGDVDAIASQDFDSLLFGASKIIRNLSITRRRKKAGKESYGAIMPVEVTLADVLNQLGIDRNQLIVLGILVGTDYNIGGVKGIGPQRALKLLKQHGNDFETIFAEVGWKNHFDFPWKDVYELFISMDVTDEYDLRWSTPDPVKLKKILTERHGFEQSRIGASLDRLEKSREKAAQTGLEDFA